MSTKTLIKDLSEKDREHYEALKNFKPKDREFILTRGRTPVTWEIRNRHTEKRAMLWYDYINQEQLELRYCTNQPSVLVKEQQGAVIIGDIVFVNGRLFVPKENVALQKLLLFYHPDRNIVFEEFDPAKKAEEELSMIQSSAQAGSLALSMDIHDLEAIGRVALGNAAEVMKSSELRRDMYRWATENPKQFMELADDSEIQLRNLVKRALNAQLLTVTDSGTTVRMKGRDKPVLKVPFGQNPTVQLVSFLTTDEGLDLMSALEKQLKS